MRPPKTYFAYIITNRSKTLYTGVTNNLTRRVREHKMGVGSAFAARRLVHRSFASLRMTTLVLPLRAQLLKEQANRLDPAIKVWDVEFLIGSVQVVVGQTEAHHHAGDL